MEAQQCVQPRCTNKTYFPMGNVVQHCQFDGCGMCKKVSQQERKLFLTESSYERINNRGLLNSFKGIKIIA